MRSQYGCNGSGLGLAGALVVLLGSAAPAFAGGFAVREQSTEFQGMSFAGNAAAGGGLSGMFWNPAIAAFAPAGIYTESHAAAVFGSVDMTAQPGTTPPLLGLNNNSGDIARDAVVPASYMSLRLSQNLVFALGTNSPFGLVTEPQNRNWSGRSFATTSEIKTYNFNPTLAYRFSPSIAVGVGMQIQRIEGRLKSANPLLPGAPNNIVQGDDVAFGFTAGVNFTPTATTQIGIGYRSSIDTTLEGTFFVSGAPFPAAAIKAGTTLPEIVTASLRQALTPNLALLGTVEWSHWNRLEKLDIVCIGGAGPLCPGGRGSLINSLHLGWDDGWFFSLGLEHRYSERMLLRGGVGYEISPVRDETQRSVRVPDADRIWASVGLTYQLSPMMAFDLAYTHIFVEDSRLDRIENGLRLVADVDASVDIVSASLKIKFGAEPHAPMK